MNLNSMHKRSNVSIGNRFRVTALESETVSLAFFYYYYLLAHFGHFAFNILLYEGTVRRLRDRGGTDPRLRRHDYRQRRHRQGRHLLPNHNHQTTQNTGWWELIISVKIYVLSMSIQTHFKDVYLSKSESIVSLNYLFY